MAELVYLTTLSGEYVDKNDKFLKYVKGIVKEYQQMQGRREE